MHWQQTAATMTMNSPESLTELFNLATASKDKTQAVQTAELMREIGLKCIGFNGVRPPPFLSSKDGLVTNLNHMIGPSNDQLSRSLPRQSTQRGRFVAIYETN